MLKVCRRILAGAQGRDRRLGAAGLASMAVLVCALLSLGGIAAAQNISAFDTGTITGTITDPSGAVIPNASVTVTNTETGVATQAKTNGDGIFKIGRAHV